MSGGNIYFVPNRAIGTGTTAANSEKVTRLPASITSGRAVYTNGTTGKLAVSATTSTELGYLSGVTSAIQTQLNAKAPLASPALTGTPTAPTAAAGTNTTQIATTAFVTNAVAQGFVANDAMVFKGLIGSNQTITQLPTSGYNAGWTYRVANAGIFAGEYCEVGDLIIAVNDYDSSTASNADWTKIEHNIDGALFMGHTGSALSDGTKLLNVTGGGVVTTSSSTVGSLTKPVFLNAGTLTETTHSLNATVNSGTANQVAYYSDANTIDSMAPAWQPWTAGSTNGPQANIQIGNAIYQSAAIPSATATDSGIVTTAAQTFAGDKTFQGNIFPAVSDSYNLGSTALRWKFLYGVRGIDLTNTGATGITVNNTDIVHSSSYKVDATGLAGIYDDSHSFWVLSTDQPYGDTWLKSKANRNIIFERNGTENARFDTTGHFIPGTTETFNLGSTTKYWNNAYIKNIIYSSGEANRLVWTDNNKLIKAANHYANSTKIAINSTSEPSYNLYVNGSQKINSGSLQIYPTGGSYNDGIRIHARSSDSKWAALMLCGSDNTGDTGTSANSWFIGNNSGSLYITKNGNASSATGYLAATTETVDDTNYGYWAFYHRVGINGKNTSYNLYVNGTSLFTNAVRIQYQGKPANLYLYDNSNDTSTHSIIRLGAATNENAAYIFLNGPSRTNDGGANLMTIRNNVGNLRLNNLTIFEYKNTWLDPSRLQIGRYDATAGTSDRAVIGVTDGNLHIDSYDAKEIYLQYYASNKYVRSGHIRPLTTNAYSLGDSNLRWSKLYVGTADSYGAANQPIYWNAGVPAAIDWRVGNSGTGEHNANNVAYNFCGYYTSNGPATTIGASTTDGAIYAQAYSSTWVGQIAQDYRDGGLFVRGKNNGTWQAWKQIPMTTTASVGSATQPVYINAGTVTECTAYTGLLTAFSSSTNTLSITVGGTTKTTTAVNSVSNTWTAGTTAGPTLKTTVNGVAGTAVAIPSAAAGASGVVTTGAQQFDGNKTFKGHIYPQANATYDIGSTSLRWRTGYLSASLFIGGTGYTATNSAAAGSYFGAGNIEMSGSTPFIDFHAGNNTGDYPARIISDTAGRITITGNVTPADLTYNGRAVSFRFYCNGHQYNNGTVESNNALIVNRAASSGGIYVMTNGKQIARLYSYRVGTASDGTTQGTAGLCLFEIGNNVAQGAATSTDGANNAQGLIRIFNTTAGYADITGTYTTLGGTNRNAITMGYVNATQVWGAVWNDYAEFRETKENVEPGRCVKEIGDDTLAITTKRLERGCEIVSDTYGFAIGETDKSKTPIAASGRVLAYPYESREEFASHIGWPVCSGPNGTVSIMTEEEEEKYPSRIIGTISAVPDYEEWGTGNVKVNGRVWIRIR